MKGIHRPITYHFPLKISLTFLTSIIHMYIIQYTCPLLIDCICRVPEIVFKGSDVWIQMDDDELLDVKELLTWFIISSLIERVFHAFVEVCILTRSVHVCYYSDNSCSYTYPLWMYTCTVQLSIYSSLWTTNSQSTVYSFSLIPKPLHIYQFQFATLINTGRPGYTTGCYMYV